MIKTTLAALLLTFFMAPAMGHEHGGSHKAQRMIEHMDEQLELSDDQRSQIEAVFKEQHEKHKALRSESKSKMAGILNADQQARFEQMKAERKAKWQQKRENCKSDKTAE